MDVISYDDERLFKVGYEFKAICTTVDSIKKIYYRIKDNLGDYIVFVDEIHSILLHLLKSTTLKNKRRECFQLLGKILKGCKQIILSDGNICNNTFKYLEALGRGEYNFYNNEYKSFNNINVVELDKIGDVYKQMKTNISNNEFFQVCNNTKKLSDTFRDFLKSNVENKECIKNYTSEEGEAILDVEKEWFNCYITFSPSIIVGVDRNSENPEDVFVIIDGTFTLNPEQISQQICRNRNIRTVYILFLNTTNKLEYKDLDNVKEYYKNLEISYSNTSTFKEIIDTISTIDGIVYKDNLFSEMFYEVEYQNDIMKSNLKYNLFNILKEKGFICYNKIDFKTIKEQKEDVSDTPYNNAEKSDEAKIKYNNFIENATEDDKKTNKSKFESALYKRLEICNIKLPKDTKERDEFREILIKYKNIFNDNKEFNQYIQYIRPLLYNNDYLNDRVYNNLKTDYIENISKSEISTVLNFKKMIEKYLPELDVYNFRFISNDERFNGDINVSDEDYNYIKKIIRTNKKKPTNKREFLSVIYLYSKNIYNDLLFKKQDTERENGKVNHYNIITFDKDKFNIYIEITKYYLYSKNNIEKVNLEVRNRFLMIIKKK